MSCVTTKPLKEHQITKIMEALDQQCDYNLLAITALLMKATRISDVLKTLTIADVYTESGNLREQIEFKEAKTGKSRIIPLKGRFLTTALNGVYKTVEHRDRNSNLFYSQKGRFSGVVMSTVTVNRNLKKFLGKWGVEAISSHAIRKTACRLMYEKGINLTTISELLNHSDTKISARYICVNCEDVSNALSVLEF